MLKLLLEKKNRTLRANDQYEVEVKDLAEAVKVKAQALGHWGASEYQYAETGRVTFEDGTTNFIGMNGRIWDRCKVCDARRLKVAKALKAEVA